MHGSRDDHNKAILEIMIARQPPEITITVVEELLRFWIEDLNSSEITITKPPRDDDHKATPRDHKVEEHPMGLHLWFKASILGFAFVV